MARAVRILAVASTGGHWVQLLRLSQAWKGLDVIYVTTDPGVAPILRAEAKLAGKAEPRLRVIQEANRWQKRKLVKQLFQLFFIILWLRPDAVITTGAAPGYFALRLGKMFGARTVWIDSIANAEELSLSGRKVRKYADLWLTQWSHLAKPEGPQFLGAVL